jgi:hypothetical protein
LPSEFYSALGFTAAIATAVFYTATAAVQK